APCRSFAGALLQTNAGGEIAVLDTAGYGTVTIGKAISIVNEEGVEAGITATGGADGITIAARATDVVNLPGLTIVSGPGSTGVTFPSGGAVNIQKCVIRGFAQSGLNLVPTVSTDINVADTIVSGNGRGITLQPAGTNLTVSASFAQVQAIHN